MGKWKSYMPPQERARAPVPPTGKILPYKHLCKTMNDPLHFCLTSTQADSNQNETKQRNIRPMTFKETKEFISRVCFKLRSDSLYTERAETVYTIMAKLGLKELT